MWVGCRERQLCGLPLIFSTPFRGRLVALWVNTDSIENRLTNDLSCIMNQEFRIESENSEDRPARWYESAMDLHDPNPLSKEIRRVNVNPSMDVNTALARVQDAVEEVVETWKSGNMSTNSRSGDRVENSLG